MVENPRTIENPQSDQIALLEQALESRRSVLGEEKYLAIAEQLEKFKELQKAIDAEKKIIAEKEAVLRHVSQGEEPVEETVPDAQLKPSNEDIKQSEKTLSPEEYRQNLEKEILEKIDASGYKIGYEHRDRINALLNAGYPLANLIIVDISALHYSIARKNSYAKEFKEEINEDKKKIIQLSKYLTELGVSDLKIWPTPEKVAEINKEILDDITKHLPDNAKNTLKEVGFIPNNSEFGGIFARNIYGAVSILKDGKIYLLKPEEEAKVAQMFDEKYNLEPFDIQKYIVEEESETPSSNEHDKPKEKQTPLESRPTVAQKSTSSPKPAIQNEKTRVDTSIDRQQKAPVKKPGWFKKLFRRAGLIGGAAVISGFAGTGVEQDTDGGLGYNPNKLIEMSISPLPEEQEQWAKRGLSKAGIYEIPEASLEYKTNENALVLTDFPTVVVDKSANPEIQKLKEKVAKLEYFEKITYTKKIAEVIDAKGSANLPKSEALKLWSFRNQWANEQGFQYIPAPNKGNQRGESKTYNNVLGVAHFLLDCDVSQGQRDFKADQESDADHFIHSENSAYLRIARENNHYVPTFTREGDRIRVKYKKFNEITSDEKIMAPLRQVRFDDIDFNSTQKFQGFVSAQEVMLKQGLTNPYVNQGNRRGTFFIFTGDKTSYSQYSGASVVFIFEDKQGNRIVRDFAGSINDIRQEGLAIEKEFQLSPGVLTIGIHDVGSFSAKPVADQNNTYRTSQSSGYNWSDVTGGGLLIPTQQM